LSAIGETAWGNAEYTVLAETGCPSGRVNKCSSVLRWASDRSNNDNNHNGNLDNHRNLVVF